MYSHFCFNQIYSINTSTRLWQSIYNQIIDPINNMELYNEKESNDMSIQCSGYLENFKTRFLTRQSSHHFDKASIPTSLESPVIKRSYRLPSSYSKICAVKSKRSHSLASHKSSDNIKNYGLGQHRSK